MKYALIFLFTFHCFSQSARGQARYIRDHTVPVKSIDISDTGYADLQPLAEAIGDKRIVMLGELYHGDATAFKAKARLVRYLHEKLGFGVLAFESDFFALNHGWDAYKAGRISLDSLIYLSVYPVWTQCSEWQAIPRYIRESAGKNELTLTGFDNRGFSGYGMRHLARMMDSFLLSTQIPFTKDPSFKYYIRLLRAAPVIIGGGRRGMMDSLVHFTGLSLQQLSPQDRNSFYGKVLESQQSLFRLAVYYKYDSLYSKTGKDYPAHDRQMALNLQWLAKEKYSDKKIIVWAHNMHIEKGDAEKTGHNAYTSMGRYFTQDDTMARQTYIIGFTSYTGQGKLMLGRGAEKIKKASKNSLESWMHAAGHPYSFIDFTGMNAQSLGEAAAPFFMKSYISAETSALWNNYYDGVFFIDEMHPCTPVEGSL